MTRPSIGRSYIGGSLAISDGRLTNKTRDPWDQTVMGQASLVSHESWTQHRLDHVIPVT